MKTLKFRAWDSNANTMIKFDFNNMVIPEIYEQLYSINDVFATGLKVMQYTGLIDRNGKEIYEGDIVHIPYNRLGNIVVAFKDGQYNISGYKWEVCKVVGNIYEYPELAKCAR